MAILTYKKPLEEIGRYLQAHHDYLAEHRPADDFISGYQIVEFTPAMFITDNLKTIL